MYVYRCCCLLVQHVPCRHHQPALKRENVSLKTVMINITINKVQSDMVHDVFVNRGGVVGCSSFLLSFHLITTIIAISVISCLKTRRMRDQKDFFVKKRGTPKQKTKRGKGSKILRARYTRCQRLSVLQGLQIAIRLYNFLFPLRTPTIYALFEKHKQSRRSGRRRRYLRRRNGVVDFLIFSY